MLLFAVIDERAQLLAGSPFPARSSVEAIRSVAQAAKDPKNMMSQYPEDYSLFQLGEVTDDFGILKPQENGPVRIAFVRDMVRPITPPEPPKGGQ